MAGKMNAEQKLGLARILVYGIILVREIWDHGRNTNPEVYVAKTQEYFGIVEDVVQDTGLKDL